MKTATEPPKIRIPSLRRHKATGQAYVVLNDRTIYLGRYGTDEATENYHKTIAEWLANGKQPETPPNDIKVNEVLARFWIHAQQYYRDATATRPQSLEISVFPCGPSASFTAIQKL